MFRCGVKQLGVAAVALILSACANVSSISPSYDNKVEDGRLYGLEKWLLKGRLAISAPGDSWTANIEWGHLPEAEKIKLSGPLGQGAVVIELAEQSVKIDRGGGNIQTSTRPEEFINQQLGIPVPIGSLRYWAVGLPEPGSRSQKTVDGFVQNGWLIAYKEMQQSGLGLMPHKMAVSNARIKLKLIVDRWDSNDGKFN